MIVGLDGVELIGDECGDEVDEGIDGRGCLGRLKEENALMCPMMVSAMFLALSRVLSASVMGRDFMFLCTRVNSTRP